MAAKKKAVVAPIKVERARITFVLKGTTHFIQNRLPNKVIHELLLPAAKKTAGDKRNILKHDPYVEFASAVHRSLDPKSPTLIVHPAMAFKSAMRNVAVDIPGTTSKAQLGRMTFIEEDVIPIYGIPELRMDPVRNRDINRTPDIRTRVCIREWVAIVTLTYTKPIINQGMIIDLMGHAGWLQGVGDFRPEKGAGNYGTWILSDLDDPDVKHIMKTGNRKAQEKALLSPGLYDADTEELLSWFESEVGRRGLRRVD